MKSIISFILICTLLILPIHHSAEKGRNAMAVMEMPSAVEVKQSHFDYVYDRMRFEEGNYAWLKDDFGGETYGGITRNFNPKWSGWNEIDAAKIVNGKRQYRLKWNQRVEKAEPHVKAFYYDWWASWGMETIKDSLSSMYTFDFAICGPSSVKIIQKCLNSFNYHFKVNGRMSPEMTEAINELDPVVYVATLHMMRKDFYIYISNKLHRVKGRDGKYIRNDSGNYVLAKTQKKFLRGWLIRANRVTPELKKRVNTKG